MKKDIGTCSFLLLMVSLAVSPLTGCGNNSSAPQKLATGSGEELDHDETHSHDDEDGHTHHQGVPGPNGGRLIVSVEPHFEFLIQPDRFARITFVNDDIEPIPPVDLNIILRTGDRSNPVEINFTRQKDVMVSNAALPEQEKAPLILQVGGDKGKEPILERFYLNLETCAECQLQEYACICDHHH
jgi:hypothetical protein